MPETIKFTTSGLKDFTEWFIIHAITELPKEEQDKLYSQDLLNNSVTLTINGIELPVRKTFEYIDSQLDEIVAREAKKLVKEKLDNLIEPAYEKLSELRQVIDDVVDKIINQANI